MDEEQRGWQYIYGRLFQTRPPSWLSRALSKAAFHLSKGRISRKKHAEACFFLVGEDGFEPSKALPADLQSVPFGHSGIPPYELVVLLRRISRGATQRSGRDAKRKTEGADVELSAPSRKRNAASFV